MYCFSESLRLPALGSEDLDTLCQQLEQQFSKAAVQPHVAPASAHPKLTDNSAAAFGSSGSARVDLFFKCEQGQDALMMHQAALMMGQDASMVGQEADEGFDTLLSQAWQEDPLDTLKLIAHLRDIRDGKGDQKQFYSCVQWLTKQHPLTLAANLSQIVQVGYWKDLLEMLKRMCLSPQASLEKAKSRKRGRDGGVARGSYKPIFKATEDQSKVKLLQTMRKKEFRKHLRSLKTAKAKEEAKAERAKQVAQKAETLQQLIKQQKDNKKAACKEAVEKLYAEGGTFQLLHVTVARLFAEQLQKDLAALKEGRSSDVSLAAKWAPTPARGQDKVTWIATSIAELLFSSKEHRGAGQSYSDFITHIRGLYHKTVLVPLRKCLDITEVYMSAKAWGDVQYPRVPSVCMRNNKDKFEKHDKERFQEYLDDVKSGKKKIASGALKPHELVREAMRLGDYGVIYSGRVGYIGDSSGSSSYSYTDTEEDEAPEQGEKHDVQQQTMDVDSKEDEAQEQEEKQDVQQQTMDVDTENNAKEQEEKPNVQQQTMELQWKSYVTNLKKSGTLSSALSVCDVSGSMNGEPMEVCIALGLLTAEVTAAPFNKLVCTFSANPVLHEVKGESLVQQVRDLRGMEWGMNTDLNKAFDLILHRAIVHNIAPEEMVQTLFVYSDMQFDQACGSQTNFHAAQNAFQKEGYKLPKVVFWNLAGSATVPVTQDEEGAALVSGFSGQLLKLFMGGASELEKFTPFTVMKEAVSAEKYDSWKVVD